ncbi:MAG: aminotransferase DegT [Candidatus Marinimicrobia bacterium]|nr:aminotransferase DegT [Candidatus Neomarinimicrobiota bacterium]|tara:strand:+ start:5503 stop:6651 length:1149 start_codon:yes stop_codon:yes gene_type:complete
MINLVKDTIDQEDLNSLIEWLKTNPRLTKGELTIKFEEKWSQWLGVRHSIFVNSGSSANLALIYAIKLLQNPKRNNIILPAVSWSTTVSPAIQFGFNPILCEADKETLGLDLNHFEILCKKYNPVAVMLVHVLGFPCKMKEIKSICKKYGVILLEDTCESHGSKYNNKKLGSIGDASTFSFYFGHHISTIEGGMICTDDTKLFNLLKSIRCHGWSRDLDSSFSNKWRKKWSVDNFKDLYTFYIPGFNLRSTDLQAFIGLRQLEKIDYICESRNKNYIQYHKLIKNNYWKISPTKNSWVSNFAYPIIHPNKSKIVENLQKNMIETRPLICGSIGQQPFWKKIYGECSYEMADLVDNFGLYLPNNHQLSNQELTKICKTVNEVI